MPAIFRGGESGQQRSKLPRCGWYMLYLELYRRAKPHIKFFPPLVTAPFGKPPSTKDKTSKPIPPTHQYSITASSLTQGTLLHHTFNCQIWLHARAALNKYTEAPRPGPAFFTAGAHRTVYTGLAGDLLLVEPYAAEQFTDDTMRLSGVRNDVWLTP